MSDFLDKKPLNTEQQRTPSACAQAAHITLGLTFEFDAPQRNNPKLVRELEASIKRQRRVK